MITSKISTSFHKLAQTCGDVLFWETNKELEITYINNPELMQLGLKGNELIGKKIFKIFLHKNKDMWSNIINEQSSFKNICFEFKAKKGPVTYLSTSGTAIVEDEVLTGFYGICVKETNKTISEKVIQRLRTTRKTILHSIKAALIIVDINERILVISPAFNRLWGFKRGEIHLGSINRVKAKMAYRLAETHKNTSLDFTQHMESSSRFSDILNFKDGRTVERKSIPHIDKGKIIGRCWTFHDISQQANLVEKLGKLAFRDSLTKLYNRRWCEKKLKQLLRGNNKNNLTFMYLDLDHFKVINDSCGHIYGDEVLEDISQILMDTIGSNAYLSRLGGDEFGLILLEKTQEEVLKLSVKIKDSIAEYSYQWKEKLFKIGVSIGVVFVNEEDSFRSVFINADEACYISKDTGRNKCTVYNAKDLKFKKTKTELKWYDAIQKALLKGKFELWCQSINDTKALHPHFEVLLRMRNEQNKLISPALFMGSADRFGMILSIDKHVFEAFCVFYENNIKHIEKTMFSINISGYSLSREGFLTFVLNCIQKHKINCHNICFELTETELIKNLESALIFIKEVRKLGCKISLDDFGKGLTSFSYLKNIPFDYIKIDGQFIKEINNDKINEAIIKSIVYISEVMGKKTIAEHIETEEMLNQIEALGVNYFQGNYFSKPHKITKLLE